MIMVFPSPNNDNDNVRRPKLLSSSTWNGQLHIAAKEDTQIRRRRLIKNYNSINKNSAIFVVALLN